MQPFVNPQHLLLLKEECLMGVALDVPPRIIFDVENISEHEKAAGAKSEGLTSGPHGCKVQAS